MRQQDNIFERQIAGVNIRLIVENIEAGRPDMPRFQGCYQSVIVNRTAAAGIDDDGA